MTDTRGFGLLGAIELEPEAQPGARGFRIMCKAFEAGLVLRVSGDTLILAPPFAATAEQIVEMVETLRKVVVATVEHAQSGIFADPEGACNCANYDACYPNSGQER